MGARPKVTVSFYDEDDALADPSAVDFKVEAPDGTITPYTHPHAAITNPSTGVWVFQFPSAIDAPGEWWVKATGSGGGADAVVEVSFVVARTHIP
jgi:hypothetical protein